MAKDDGDGPVVTCIVWAKANEQIVNAIAIDVTGASRLFNRFAVGGRPDLEAIGAVKVLKRRETAKVFCAAEDDISAARYGRLCARRRNNDVRQIIAIDIADCIGAGAALLVRNRTVETNGGRG